MQVDWMTIEAIAKTEAIDLWILFPLGVAVNRLLTKNEPPPKRWADALTRVFGTDEWKQQFYPKKKELTKNSPCSATRRRSARTWTLSRSVVSSWNVLNRLLLKWP